MKKSKQFDILFSVRIGEFLLHKINFCVKMKKKIIVTNLKSQANFKWSSSVPGQ